MQGFQFSANRMLLMEAAERSLMLLLWRREEALAGMVWNLRLGWQRLMFFSYASSGWEEDGSSLYGCCRLTVYHRWRTVGGKRETKVSPATRWKHVWWLLKVDGHEDVVMVVPGGGGGGGKYRFGFGVFFLFLVFFMSSPVFSRNVPLYEDIYL